MDDKASSSWLLQARAHSRRAELLHIHGGNQSLEQQRPVLQLPVRGAPDHTITASKARVTAIGQVPQELCRWPLDWCSRHELGAQ